MRLLFTASSGSPSAVYIPLLILLVYNCHVKCWLVGGSSKTQQFEWMEAKSHS